MADLNRRFAAGLNSVPKVTQRLLRTMFVGLDQVVPVGVGFVIDLLPRRVGVEPGHGLADALRERYGRAVARNETLDLGISKTTLTALSPRRPPRAPGTHAAMKSLGICTRRGSTPAASAVRRYHWSQHITSSLVMWKACPMVCSRASSPTSPLAKSVLWVMTQSDEPSPGTITFLPRRMRSTAV